MSSAGVVRRTRSSAPPDSDGDAAAVSAAVAVDNALVQANSQLLVRPIKKETFQWSTPADEFAEDVGSDAEDLMDLGDLEDAVVAAASDRADEEEGDGPEVGGGGCHVRTEVDAEPGRPSVVSAAPAAAKVRSVEGAVEKGALRRREKVPTSTPTAAKVSAAAAAPAKKASKKTTFDNPLQISSLDLGVVKIKKEKSQCREAKKTKQQFPCPKCDKVWNWPWELRRHLIMHFKEKERLEASPYVCDLCGKGFQWKRDLAQHMRLHTGERLLVCTICGKKFVTRQALLHHVVVHTGEKPFQCALCGNRFTQPANLRTHTKKKHGKGPIHGCKCPYCSETFSSVVGVHQHILEDHQKVVVEEQELRALEKLKVEQEKLDKERARLEHKKKRALKRLEQGKVSRSGGGGGGGSGSGSLAKEWEVNYEFNMGEGMVQGVDWDRTPSNGELSCDECSCVFGWRYEIMFHRLCHLKDADGNTKNRVCPECQTVFKVPIGLKHHLLLHTGELPFLCLHCWRSFSCHIDLKLHIRREHLFHLKLPTPGKVQARKALKQETDGKRVKREPGRQNQGQEHQEQVTFIIQDSEQAGGETLQFVQLPDGQLVATTSSFTNGEEGQQHQAIVVNSDGTLVSQDGQDMIVVIQSDDYDQSQGLIIVDPSQLRHVLSGADGQTVVVQEQDGGEAANQEGEPEAAAGTVSNGETSGSVATETPSAGSGEGEVITSDPPLRAASAMDDDQVVVETDEATGAQYISLQVNEDGSATLVGGSTDGGHQQIVLAESHPQDEADGEGVTETFMVVADVHHCGEGELEGGQQDSEVKGDDIKRSVVVQDMMIRPYAVDEAIPTASPQVEGEVVQETDEVEVAREQFDQVEEGKPNLMAEEELPTEDEPGA